MSHLELTGSGPLVMNPDAKPEVILKAWYQTYVVELTQYAGDGNYDPHQTFCDRINEEHPFYRLDRTEAKVLAIKINYSVFSSEMMKAFKEEK